jgi:hypothetical protein
VKVAQSVGLCFRAVKSFPERRLRAEPGDLRLNGVLPCDHSEQRKKKGAAIAAPEGHKKVGRAIRAGDGQFTFLPRKETR